MAKGKTQIGVTVVIVLLTVSEGALKTLFLKSRNGQWALPLGKLSPAEPLRKAAERVIADQIGIKVEYLEQLYTFGNQLPKSGPRTIEVSYYGLTPSALLRSGKLADTQSAKWFSESEQPKLAGGHELISRVARNRLRGKVDYTAVGFELLPEQFKLTELQNLYEVILGRVIDKRNFRKKINDLGILERVGEKRPAKGTRGRPAALFRFSREVFEEIESKGTIFPF